MLFWPGDTINTIIGKHDMNYEEEEDEFVQKEKINNHNNVVNSNGREVLDFPKPRVTRVAHDSGDRAQQPSVDRVSTRVGSVPVLSTNTTTVKTTCYDVDDVDCDVVGDQTHDTHDICHDICHSCERKIWISSMDIHGGADSIEKANHTG